MKTQKKSVTDKQMREIAARIQAKRQERNLSFQDLATITGMSKSTLQRYETGGIKNIPLSKLNVLATALGVTPEWIMGWDTSGSGFDLNDRNKALLSDPFTYAMFAEAKTLTAEDKALLISMAKQLNEARKKEK